MEEILTKPVHSKQFRKRRAINWLTLGITYATMYMGRYNLSFANKSLSDSFGWDKTQIGAIITAALTLYGLSALFNGPLADKIGGRKAMLIGSSGTVVFNVLFGLGAYMGGQDWNVVGLLFGTWPGLANLVYVLVGIAGVWALYDWYTKMSKK